MDPKKEQEYTDAIPDDEETERPKAEGFDYTKWQREYFDKKTKEEIDLEMDAYFATHPYSGDSKKVI